MTRYAAIVCSDGFRMSVQADDAKYCTPRNDNGPYTHAEVGFPSQYDMHLQPYAEEPKTPTETVYGYVPAIVIRLCIESHGGQVDGELPKFTIPAWNGDGSGEDWFGE
jgi:hypothetical protein